MSPSCAKRSPLEQMKQVRVDAQPLDAFQVASEIAAYAADKGFDLVMAGKETIDYNGAQVGGMVAALMHLPYVF